MSKNILVTGGCGFIGSEFVRQIVEKDYNVIVVDNLSYAGDLKRLEAVENKYKFYKADICDFSRLESIFKIEQPEAVIHFAAQTHVDNSITNPFIFEEVNVRGTLNLLNVSKQYKVKKFISISTDEVYGEIKKGKFTESSPLQPNSPYSASKAAADCFVKAYQHTYSFPAIIVRCSNNYGPWQYPEKFMPVVIYKALKNEKVPVYGKGMNVREWLCVVDCARAIQIVLEKGSICEIYNIGSGVEKRNIDTAKQILKELNKPESLIEFVCDRPGHDFRYSLDCSKMERLGWQCKYSFETGVKEVIRWSRDNFDWIESKVENIRSLQQEGCVRR